MPQPPPSVPHSIYFVLVDRYANGDPANDGVVDRTDPQAFHGGDLQGVLNHLPEIQSLGFDTVWLSPVWKMRTEKFFEHGAFHGYWVQDPSQIEPRFGDEALLRRLSDALHARQMKLILDMVYNHVSFDSPLKTEHPDWFHPALPIVHWDDPIEVQTHEVHGLPDLNQDNPDVYSWISGWTKHWMDTVHPDGFRIDAVRHMPTPFLHRLSTDIRSWGNPAFYLLGELFDGDPVVVRDTIESAGLSSAFDFPLHYAMVDVFCKDQPLGRLGSILSLDRLYGDPNRLVTFLDNHDVSRIMSACKNDPHRVQMALAFWLSQRGTPSLYYGTEMGLAGEKEPENRGDMTWGDGIFSSEVRTLLRLRNELWERGTTETVWLDQGLLVLERRCATENCDKRRRGTIVVARRPLTFRLDGDWTSLWGPALHDSSAPCRGAECREKLLDFAEPGVAVLEGPSEPITELETKSATFHLLNPDPNARYHLAGAGPKLGNWNPAKAPLFSSTGDLEFTFNRGEVIACKLVKEEDGQVTWEPGPDRYFWRVPDGKASLTWGKR